MELAVILLFGSFVWLARRFLFRNTDLAGAMGSLFVGLRSDGWPTGVQEEDRDRRWGRQVDQIAVEPLQPRPTLVRVQPVVRHR